MRQASQCRTPRSDLRSRMADSHMGAVSYAQAMEQRYTALADEQGRLAAENERLTSENQRLAEVRRMRMRISRRVGDAAMGFHCRTWARGWDTSAPASLPSPMCAYIAVPRTFSRPAIVCSSASFPFTWRHRSSAPQRQRRTSCRRRSWRRTQPCSEKMSRCVCRVYVQYVVHAVSATTA